MDYDLPPPGPIADLSYRNYTGPLRSRAGRWWIIARATIRLAAGQTGIKIVAALAVLPYVVSVIILYFQSNILPGQRLGPLLGSLMSDVPGQRFSIQFYNALGYQILLLLVLTLLAGAGLIASDNRTNALLVYLSKPITKSDYLGGKWVGLFLVIFTVAIFPALLLYIYCLLSYFSDGFLRQEPWLILHIMETTAFTAAFLTSIMMGISAWTKSPSMAGAVMAGLYFASYVVATFMWASQAKGDMSSHTIEMHSSIGGIISGASQWIYKVTIHTTMYRRRTGPVDLDFVPPSALFTMGTAAVLTLAGVIAARMRVRAVEVIQG